MAKRIRSISATSAEALVAICCIMPSLIVGIYGLDRPYDAIPDQDMLWASEALRLIRNVAPSYADHPGAFWSLMYKANINAAQRIFGLNIINQDGYILPAGLDVITRLARLQNAALAGLCSALTYPTARLLSIRKSYSAAASLAISFSSATLVAVSEVRHESISVLFMIIFVLATSMAPGRFLSPGARIALSLMGLICFFIAAFSKQQILLCAPLAFIAILASHRTCDEEDYKSRLDTLAALAPQPGWAGLALICASAPWLICASPDIDLINLPAWIFINIGLSLSISPSLGRSRTKPSIFKPLLIVGAFEIIIFKALAPSWWRQAVTGFPSWMFRHANPAGNRAAQAIDGINTYMENLFIQHNLATIALIGSAATCAVIAIKKGCDEPRFSRLDHLVAAATWTLILALMAACSLRPTPRYEIFFFIPIIITAAKSLENASIDSIAQDLKPLEVTRRAFAVVLLITALSRAAANAGNLQTFVNPGQPRSFLCFGQHMDRTMRLTSARKCSNFNMASIDKDRFDSWTGPR